MTWPTSVAVIVVLAALASPATSETPIVDPRCSDHKTVTKEAYERGDGKTYLNDAVGIGTHEHIIVARSAIGTAPLSLSATDYEGGIVRFLISASTWTPVDWHFNPPERSTTSKLNLAPGRYQMRTWDTAGNESSALFRVVPPCNQLVAETPWTRSDQAHVRDSAQMVKAGCGESTRRRKTEKCPRKLEGIVW